MNDESRKFFETVRDYLQIYMAKQRVMSQDRKSTRLNSSHS